MKTIVRRKSWPKWARWISQDHNGWTELWSGRPRLCRNGWAPRSTATRCMLTLWRTLGNDWTKTLRRIVDRRSKIIAKPAGRKAR